jgi:hypothetical protein
MSHEMPFRLPLVQVSHSPAPSPLRGFNYRLDSVQEPSKCYASGSRLIEVPVSAVEGICGRWHPQLNMSHFVQLIAVVRLTCAFFETSSHLSQVLCRLSFT